ncbi:MAG TPA: hypothetical protein VKV15_03925 [Bryobacteraceae bacterium]|nr:hypothetical protein [Bryobacteraceae bacterium]
MKHKTPKPKRGPGAPTGHPGWGGRPRGITMPCGWCGKALTASEMRAHFTSCAKRPEEAEAGSPKNSA